MNKQMNLNENNKIKMLKQGLKDWIFEKSSTLIKIVTFIWIVLSFLFSKHYAWSCEKFYGVDSMYFSGKQMIENGVFFAFCVLFLIITPLILIHINKKFKSRLASIFLFLAVGFILFMQNIIYTAGVVEAIPWDWLKGLIDNNVVIAIFIVADIIIAYFAIIRDSLLDGKKCRKIEKVILSATVLIYILSVATGITVKMDQQIKDKKRYTIIDENRAIISQYNDKFVVMDCEIRDDVLSLKKGSYRFEEMTEVPLKYREFRKVDCDWELN